MRWAVLLVAIGAAVAALSFGDGTRSLVSATHKFSPDPCDEWLPPTDNPAWAVVLVCPSVRWREPDNPFDCFSDALQVRHV